jgi:hypothetical protein
MSAVQVCNLALGRIGQGASRPIQSLSEDSEPARACNRVFDHLMALLQRDYTWPFSITAQALALMPLAVPGWQYVYAYPSNCKFLHALTDARTDPFQNSRLLTDCTAAFKLFGRPDGEGIMIASDQPDAWAWFNAGIADPEFADDSFREALAWRIAADIALGLKASAPVAQYAAQQFEASIAVAASHVANERGRTERPLPANIAARF